MITIAFVWVWIFFLFNATGRVVLKFLRYEEEISTTLAFMLGLVSYSTVISIWNLFLPANGWFPLALSFLIYKFILNEYYILKINYHSLSVTKKNFLIFTFLVALYLSSIRSTVYDTYLYHNSIVSFFNKSYLIPGLSHLHPRFGFNNLTYALCSSFTFDNLLPYYHFHGLLLFVILNYLIFYPSKNSGLVVGILVVSIIVWILRLGEEMLSSPDFVLSLIVLFLVVSILRNNLKFNKALVLMLVFIPTIKFSAFVFSILLFVLGFRELVLNKAVDKRFVLCCLVIVMTFVSRNILLTGQILYPVKSPYLEKFDFRISKQVVDNMVDAIDGWARFPGDNYLSLYKMNSSFTEWFPTVVKNNFNKKFTRLPFVGEISKYLVYSFCVFGFLTLLFIYLLKHNSPSRLVFSVCVFLSFLFILFKAPDDRWFAPYLLLSFFSIIILSETRVRYFFALVVFLLAVPYQTKRLVENIVINSILWEDRSILFLPQNIESSFQRKQIRDDLDISLGILDFNTIYSKLDTIKGPSSVENFIYRYSFRSQGLSPMSNEISVPYKVGENIEFTGSSFVDRDLFKLNED